MKVLWFTNNVVNLHTNVNRGGWMQSLEKYLSQDEDIQIFIATRYKGKSIRKVTEHKTTYYLIPDKRNLLKKRIDLMLNREPIETYLKEYLKVIDEINPDLIHVFGTEMDYGLICEITNIPVVIHIQGILHSCYYQLNKINISFAQKIFSQEIIDYIRGNTIANELRIFKRRMKVEEKILKSCKNVIGRTDWDKKITSIFAKRANYFHCDEILRQEFLSADWKGNDSKIIHITSTISNAMYKGHETLIATCSALKKTGVPFVWNIIGLDIKGSAYRLFYKKHIRELFDVIKLHGELKSNSIINILEKSDIYVHPSHIEHSSNGLCEAMAIGMPVIAFHVGGNSTMINHGENGLIIPDNDPYYAAATIMEVIENKEKYRMMASNAKIKALVRHNPEQITNQLKSIYKELIETNDIKK